MSGIWTWTGCSLCSLIGALAFNVAAAGGVPDADWPAYNNTVNGQRYAELDQINTGNVDQLKEVCRLKVDDAGTFQAGLVALDGTLTVAQVDRRQALLRDLDATFAEMADDSQLVEGLDSFSQQARTIITSRRSREAFDVSREDPKFAAPFGLTDFGQSCLLATRLVESGVRFVTVQLGGWDTHADNFTKLQDKLLPTLDEGLSALFLGLEQKGLLDSTAVMVTGEFGRTPKINVRGGRDHYPRSMFMLMAGGGIKGGQVVGESDEKGAGPKAEGIKPDDVAATKST
jgi:hypothetical protein